MAEHDYAIANDTAAQVRADINLALAAIVSQNSKATEPSTTFANMIWYDTANNIVKMRNEANDAWISLFELDQSGDLIADLTLTDLTVSSNLTNTRLRAQPGYTENLGMTYSSNTLTFNGYEGTALSASNPAYVCAPSKTAGQSKLYTLTANQGFIDSTGASEIIGALFGFTTSVAITVDVPYWAYGCVNDAENTMTIGVSRISNLQVAPAAGLIGKAGTPAAASTEPSLFLIEDVTVGDYDGNPLVLLGSFRMRMDGSDDHAVQALNDTDGIGKFQEGILFDVPLGQFGANASTYSVPNGGTAAVWSINAMDYKFIDVKRGVYELNVQVRGDGGTDGSGAVTALLTTPFVTHTTTGNNIQPGMGFGAIQMAGGAFSTTFIKVLPGSNRQRIFSSGVTDATWANFSNGNRTWEGKAHITIANS